MKFRIIFTAFIQILIISLTRQISLNDKLAFYTKVLTQTDKKLPISLIISNNKILMKADRNILADTPLFEINKNYILSSCSFYPYKDKIVEILNEFVVNNDSFETKSEMIIQVYSFAYQLMEYKFADKERLLNYFRDRNVYSSEYFKFHAAKEQMEYISNLIPAEEEKPLNSLNYNSEKIKLLRQIKLDNTLYDLTEKIFSYVLAHVNKNLNSEIKAHLRSFTENFEYFKKFVDAIYKHSMSDSKEYILKLIYIIFRTYISLEKGSINENEFKNFQVRLKQFSDLYPSI
jgi:hypothetical protein